jgi:DNA-binding CsgD family transcriptional regulator
VLALLGATAPVTLFLDDAQWADEASLAAVVFALRRLSGERVAVVVAGRPDPALDSLRRVAEGPHGTRLALDPLSPVELRELAGTLGVRLSDASAGRLWRHAGGDLRLARALLRELPKDAWVDYEHPLPAPRELAADVAARLARCAPATARVVEAAAVLGPGCLLADAARLAGVEASLDALDEAAAAGLVAVDRRRGVPALDFDPPAVAAAVYEQLGPARLAALHAAAAGTVDDEAAALRHLAAAAPGPDGALADRLDAFARGRRERGDAAAALLAASRLSPTRALREDRLVRAVDWMLLAGDAARARGLRDEVAACTPAARRESVLGQLDIVGDRVRDAAARLRCAWELCRPDQEPELAATIAHRNAFLALIHLRDEEVAAWARRALELAPDDPLAVEWYATLALSLWRQGRRGEAHRLLAEALSGDAERDAQLIGMDCWLRIVGDDIDEAREGLAAAAATELRLGAREIAVVHLNVLARAHFEIGAWDEAAAVAERALAPASELDDVSARVFVWWAAALVPAARGDWAAADAFARRAAAEPTDAPDRVVAVGMTHALVAAVRGDSAAVIGALGPVTAIEPAAAVEEPGFWPWQHLYAGALVSAGRLDDAQAFLARHEPLAAARGHGTAIARLAAVRGRLQAARGDREAAGAAFARALEHIEPLTRPFDHALVQLANGQFLRRDGRRRAAVTQLTTAAEVFSALGARPALERAERELVASGLRPARRGGEAAGQLTPQELTVARLVADGHSNREVAADLQLSVKTVEVHLTRIYAKLGIGSRAHLASRLGADALYASGRKA